MNMSTFTNVTEMKYWCYKVLPLVYDDSLSYYEVLCKATEKLNEVIENNNNIPEYIKEVVAEGGFFDQIQEQIAELNDGTSTTATADRFTGELIWLNGNLYRITRNMLAGDQYVTSSEGVTGNIEKLTFEQWCERYRGLIKASITSHDEKYNSESSQSYSVDDWMWWQGAFYTVIKDIAEGDRLVVGRNVQTSDLEQLIGGKIKKELAEIKVLIQNETDARTEADSKLQTELDTEISNRSDADKVLTDSVAQEVSDRTDAVSKLQTELDTEVSNRSDADSSLSSSIAQEVSDRSALIEKDGDTTVVKGEPVKISSSLPLQYGSVNKFNDYFSLVNMTDNTGTEYKLLVQTENTDKIGASNRPVDVTQHGVVADGETDNTAVLNELLDKYRCLYFPADGIYYFNGQINVPSYTKLYGEQSSLKLGSTGNILIHSYSDISYFIITCDSTANCFVFDTINGNCLNNVIHDITIWGSKNGITDNGGSTTAGGGHLGYNNKFIDITIYNPSYAGVNTDNQFGFIYYERVYVDFTSAETMGRYGFKCFNVEGNTFVFCQVLGYGKTQPTSVIEFNAFYLQGSAIWLNKCMVDTVPNFAYTIANGTYVYITDCIASLMYNACAYLENINYLQIERFYGYGRKGLSVIGGVNNGLSLRNCNHVNINNVSLANIAYIGLGLTSVVNANISDIEIDCGTYAVLADGTSNRLTLNDINIVTATTNLTLIGDSSICSNIRYTNGEVLEYNLGPITRV